MNRSRTFRRLLAVALLSAGARTLPAQQTALVPLSDWAYRDLDRLNALGLLDSAVIGQRPYSEREVDRLVMIARRAATASARSGAEAVVVDDALRRLERRFGADGPARGTLALVDDATLVGTSTNARRRGLFGDYGVLVEATIDPLADRRLGPPAERGQTEAAELAQRVEPASWLAFNARERFELRSPSDGSGAGQHSELLLGGVRARWRNLAISAGREQFGWSQREGDGLFLASDAPALDQVSLASDHPFALPGFLGRFGPAAGTLIFADLGASVVHSGSKLVAYKLSILPTPALELGATFENHFGGSGARSSSTLNRLVDFLPFIDIFRKHNYSDTTRTLDVESDKAIGADARLTLRRLGGVVIAGEWLVDDFDASRLLGLFTNDASQSLAILIPRVGSARVSLELTAKHMGIYTYTHAGLTEGMTIRGRLLGDELGPDAKAFGAVVNVEAARGTFLSIDARSAIYSDVHYFGDYVAGTNEWKVYKLSSLPDELRDRLIVSLRHETDTGLSLFGRAGGERIRNARLVANGRSYVAEVGVGLRR